MMKDQMSMETLFRRFCEGDYSILGDSRRMYGDTYFINSERSRFCAYKATNGYNGNGAGEVAIVVKSKFKYNKAKYIINSDKNVVEEMAKDCYSISFKLLDTVLKQDVKYENVEILDYSNSGQRERLMEIEIEPEYLTKIIAKSNERGYAPVGENDFIDYTGSFTGRIKPLPNGKGEFAWDEHKNKEALVRYGKRYYLMEEVSGENRYWGNQRKFITKLKKPAKTIDEALDILIPDNLKGKFFKRIGNLFFLPTEEENTRRLAGIIDAKMHRGAPSQTFKVTKRSGRKKESYDNLLEKTKNENHRWMSTKISVKKNSWYYGHVYYSDDSLLPLDADIDHIEYNQVGNAFFTNMPYKQTYMMKDFKLSKEVEGGDKNLWFEQAMLNEDGSKILARKSVKHDNFGDIDLKDIWHLLQIEDHEIYTDRDGNR